jgi:hypothetical protein
MANIKLPFFRGLVPRRGEQNMEQGQAVRAVNTDLDSGELRPMITPHLEKIFPRAGAGDFLAPTPEDPSDPIPDVPEPPNCIPVVIVVPPESREFSSVPPSITFSIQTNLNATPPVMIRWFVDDVLIPGETEETLTIDPYDLQIEYNNGGEAPTPDTKVITSLYGVIKVEVQNPCGVVEAFATVRLEDEYRCDSIKSWFESEFNRVWWDVYALGATKEEHIFPFGPTAPIKNFALVDNLVQTNWWQHCDSVPVSLEFGTPFDPCDGVVQRVVQSSRGGLVNDGYFKGEPWDTGLVALAQPYGDAAVGHFIRTDFRWDVKNGAGARLTTVSLGFYAQASRVGDNVIFRLSSGLVVSEHIVPATEVLDAIGRGFQPLIVSTGHGSIFWTQENNPFQAPYIRFKAPVGATFMWGNISLEISGDTNMGGYYLYGAENYPASYTFLTNGAFQTTLLQSARMYIAGLGAIGGNQQVIIEDAIRAFSQNKLDY